MPNLPVAGRTDCVVMLSGEHALVVVRQAAFALANHFSPGLKIQGITVMITSRDTVLQACQELQNKLNQDQGSLESIDRDFRQYYADLENNIDKTVEQTRTDLKDFVQTPLVCNVNQFIESILTQKQILKAQIAALEQNNRFREQYKNALVVYVFGKVKCGKSSLGNYLSWAHPDPAQEYLEQYQKSGSGMVQPQFKTLYVNDQTGRLDDAEHLSKFKVGVTETTSTIQSFELPGFLWVDSPGVHSVTRSNEQLAKDYLKQADLILYLENSDSPGRTSDSEEILSILDMGYHPILLITKSDTAEPDFDDNGDMIMVKKPKDKDRRQKQEESVVSNIEETLFHYARDHVLSAVRMEEVKNDIKGMQILSLSAACAHEAQNDDEFVASGMDQFFRLLTDTIASNGVKLKREAPLNTYKGFLSEISDSLNGFSQEIATLQQMSKNNHTSLRRELDYAIRDCISDLEKLFNQEFDSLDELRSSLDKNTKSNQQQFTAALEQVNNRLVQKSNELGMAIINKVVSQLVRNFQEDSIKLNLRKPSQLPSFAIDGYTKEIAVGKEYVSGSSGGGGFWSSVWSGIKSIFGFGSSSGYYRTIYESVYVRKGDNFYEIKKECRRQLLEEFEDVVSTQANAMFEQMFKRFAANLAEIDQMVLHTREDMNGLYGKIEALKTDIWK